MITDGVIVLGLKLIALFSVHGRPQADVAQDLMIVSAMHVMNMWMLEHRQ
jgi:hypothetical protein